MQNFVAGIVTAFLKVPTKTKRAWWQTTLWSFVEKTDIVIRILKNGIHWFMEKGSCVTAITLVAINQVKRLKVYNIGVTMLTKIAST